MIRPDGKFDIATSDVLEKADILCTRFPWEERSEEMAANARLMAAAPELLAALVALDDAFCSDPSIREDRHKARLALIAARAAVVKATGAAQ
jgi:hypothetical protein